MKVLILVMNIALIYLTFTLQTLLFVFLKVSFCLQIKSFPLKRFSIVPASFCFYRKFISLSFKLFLCLGFKDKSQYFHIETSNFFLDYFIHHFYWTILSFLKKFAILLGWSFSKFWLIDLNSSFGLQNNLKFWKQIFWKLLEIFFWKANWGHNKFYFYWLNEWVMHFCW